MSKRGSKTVTSVFRGLTKLMRSYRLEIGPVRASGVPAILVAVTGIVVASGVAAALARSATQLPETLREAQGLQNVALGTTAPAPITSQGKEAFTVIADDALAALIRESIPDAGVEVVDLTGTMDHFDITVRSRAFAGKTLLEQHRLVYGALKAAHADGRVHAIQLTTIVAEN